MCGCTDVRVEVKLTRQLLEHGRERPVAAQDVYRIEAIPMSGVLLSIQWTLSPNWGCLYGVEMMSILWSELP